MAFWGSTTLLRLASNILQFALAIYVLDLIGSAFVYSTVLSIIILPRILCSSFAGYLADYKDSIQILRCGTLGLTVLMACFFVIHGFVIPLNLPLIYVLVITLELCETFLGPTEAKVLLCIVAEEEIAPASKLSALDDGIVEILSPVIAALFYGYFRLVGVLGIALTLEMIAFLMTLVIRCRFAYTSISNDTEKSPIFSLRNTFQAYQEASLCLKDHAYIWGIILFAPLFNFFVGPLFSVTAPHYFRITMQANVDLYAMFNMVLGIAGLIAPFLAMSFINDEDEYKANKGGTSVAAVALLCLSCILYFGNNAIPATTSLYIVTATMALLVAIVTIMNIATSITIKRYIPEQIIGRVVSMIQLSATISVPIGQMFYGFCADKLPVTIVYLASAIGLVITFVVMNKTYRVIKIQKRRKIDE
ncbi:MFS transporter [Faecalimonas sp.]